MRRRFLLLGSSISRGSRPSARLLWLGAAIAVVAPFTPLACGSSADTTGTSSSGKGGGGTGTSAGGGGADADGGTTGEGGGDASFFDQQNGCVNGEACGDGGVCAGGECCDAALACADACCAGGQVCSFGKCVTPGATCSDSSDCPADDYCEYALGDEADAGACNGGAPILTGKCLPKPPICEGDAGAPDGGAPDCLEKCEYHPPAGSFTPVLKYAWGGQIAPPYASDVMMAPIVVELDDDDCDGKVTGRDIPEIVFSTFANGQYGGAPGVLHAIGVVGGAMVDKWSVPGVVNATKQLAGGDIDGQPGNEIVACGFDGTVRAFKADGTPLWTSAPLDCFMPSIADLDGDGAVEVVVEGGILAGATGALEHAFSAKLATSFVISDIDEDGKLDVVTASQGFHADGTLFVDTGLANQSFFFPTQDWKSPWPAVADLDRDGHPDVVVVDNPNHALSVWRYDANAPQKFTLERAPVDINGNLSPSLCPGGTWGNTHGGGPPTVADFNGDGYPDVAMAGGVGYAVFDGKKLLDANVPGPQAMLWIQKTTDCSSASTGSTVFDFDGDGKAEVIYSDENHLRIYEGPTGNVLFSTCNTTATLIENPVVADVDGDGHADIVVVSNAYAAGSPEIACNDGMANGQSGVRVFGDPSGTWVRTRRVWNEHAYHITNVGEDGAIPAAEAPNYATMGLDNFRQNKQPGSEFSAPDAIVSIAPSCGTSYALVATVRNIGEAALPAGVVVGFYEGSPPNGTKLGEGQTTKVLYPAESQAVTLELANPDPAILNGSKLVYAVVDDTQTPHPSWTECRTDNDVGAGKGTCGVVK